MKKGQEERPKCPECGGSPHSSGIRWHCSKCGRSWLKFPKNIKLKYDTKNRPPKCFSCGAKDSMVANGMVWRCKLCGKNRSKYLVGNRKELSVTIFDMVNTKVTDI